MVKMKETVGLRLVWYKNINHYVGSGADDLVKWVLLFALVNGVDGLAVVDVIDALEGLCFCVFAG